MLVIIGKPSKTSWFPSPKRVLPYPHSQKVHHFDCIKISPTRAEKCFFCITQKVVCRTKNSAFFGPKKWQNWGVLPFAEYVFGLKHLADLEGSPPPFMENICSSLNNMTMSWHTSSTGQKVQATFEALLPNCLLPETWSAAEVKLGSGFYLLQKLDSGFYLLPLNDPHLRFWRTWQVCNFLLRSSPSSAKLFLFSFLFYPKNFVADVQISYGCSFAHQWSFSQGSEVCNPPHCSLLCFLQNRDVSLFKSSLSEFWPKTPPSSPWNSSHQGTAWSQHFQPEEHQDWSENQSVSMMKDLTNKGCSTSFYCNMFTSIQQLVIVAHLNVWWLMMIYLWGTLQSFFCLCEILEIVVGGWGGEYALEMIASRELLLRLRWCRLIKIHNKKSDVEHKLAKWPFMIQRRSAGRNTSSTRSASQSLRSFILL